MVRFLQGWICGVIPSHPRVWSPSISCVRHRTRFSMPERLDSQLNARRVCVRNVPTENTVDLSLRFGNTTSTPGMKPKIFNFHRLKDETVGKTLDRIAQNLSSKIVQRQLSKQHQKGRKTLKKDSESGRATPEEIVAAEASMQPIVPPSITVALMQEETAVSPHIPNALAWNDGAVLVLDQEEYQVVVNPPTVISGKITSHILPEFPIDYQLDFEFADEDEAFFVWIKHAIGVKNAHDEIPPEVLRTAASLPISLSAVKRAIAEKMKPPGVWQIVSVNREWRPALTDVGTLVGLVCFPIRDGVVGEVYTTVSKNLVAEALPEPVPYRQRHEVCKHRAERGSFRVISYNILADVYADQESSLKDLFPYCPPEFMKSDYRRQLLVDEISGYNADLVCLQEVDTKLFSRYFDRQFRRKGFEGVLLSKKGNIAEGVVTFYRTDKFELFSRHDIAVSESLFENPLFASLADKIKEKDKLKDTMVARATPLQVTVLRSPEESSRIVVVANTHLWFRPQFPHVRLIQMAVIMRHLEEVIRMVKTELKTSSEPAVVLCGDLNSTSGWGVHNFLRTGQIAEDYSDWSQFCKEEDEFVRLALSHPFKLYSACGELPHTNFVPNFKAAIDWIYADVNSFETSSVIPVPSVEELSRHVAIPSVVFPSDHLAIGCDLRWKSS
ncbi:hypothetical protein RvY_07385 [Ramazzottius varieornatus]|uniref:Endonuclease/exonuclease/phosphatase domain-containing protein n=1 Tax=Ramazzottius varieornatus TaxID=947166 RepID=A0A1D1V4J7_RAMVA|nr:hypothetical protein RvY_07385 [Ramazzottius varieornatus]